MKKTRICLLIVSGLLVAALGAVQEAGAAGIVGSKHDLTAGGASSAFGLPPGNQELCIFCHTPHNGQQEASGVKPLWNRTLSTQVYTLYNSSTLDSNPTAQQPFGVSKACLSCHDGTVGFNALLNNRGPGNPAAVGVDQTMPDGPTRIAEGGTDLSNDHPISMRYSLANSPSGTSGTDDHATGFNLEADNGAGRFFVSDLPLYAASGGAAAGSDYVQCGTCHDPHRAPTEADAVSFLRKSNVGSALCLTCHKKDG